MAVNVNKPASLDNLPSLFEYDNKFNHLILEATEGIFFVVHCYTGRILFTSNTIKQVLNSKTNWCDKNFYHQIHLDDVNRVKENLTVLMPSHSSKILDLSREDGNDQSIRRSFICRMKLNDSKDKQDYAVVHFTGFIQRWHDTNINNSFDDDDSLTMNKLTVIYKVSTKNNLSMDSCFVAIGHIQHMCNDDIKDNMMKENTGFISRHSVEGEFLFVDFKVNDILGYEPSKLLGISLFNLIHPDDFDHMHSYFKLLLNSKGNIFLETYRIRTDNNKWIHINVSGFAFLHPSTHHVEYIVLTNDINKFSYDIDHFISHAANDFFRTHVHLEYQDSGHSMNSVAHHMIKHVAEHVTEMANEHYKPILQSRKINTIVSKMYNRLFTVSRLAKRLCSHI